MMTSQKQSFTLIWQMQKNARAFGVRWSALFYVTAQNFVTVELQILCILNMPRRLHNPRGGYPLVSRNGMLAVCKEKFTIRYLASITRARGLLFYRLLEQAVQTDLHKPNERGVDTPHPRLLFGA